MSRRFLLALLCIAQLMVILDISAVNVALPDMARDLGIRGGDIGWAITSYSLIFGSLLLLGGRAADLLGRRRVFLAGLGVFTLASLASALAGGARRAVRRPRRPGPRRRACSRPPRSSIIMAAFTQGTERAKALGAWGAVGGAGAAVGVLLGGTLTELVDWRLIFLINVPVGLALAAGALQDRARRRRAAALARPRPPRRRCSRRSASARSCSPPRRPTPRAGRRRRRSASAPPRWPGSPPSPRSSSAPRSRCCASSASPTAASAAAR